MNKPPIKIGVITLFICFFVSKEIRQIIGLNYVSILV